MPEIPRDPRQLARDILSGKISVEDLAREQQRRRAAAAGGAGAQPMARGPVPAAPQNRVPLPNLTTPPRAEAGGSSRAGASARVATTSGSGGACSAAATTG